MYYWLDRFYTILILLTSPTEELLGGKVSTKFEVELVNYSSNFLLFWSGESV